MYSLLTLLLLPLVLSTPLAPRGNRSLSPSNPSTPICKTSTLSPPTSDFNLALLALWGSQSCAQTKCSNMYDYTCNYKGTCSVLAESGGLRIEMCAEQGDHVPCADAALAVASLYNSCQAEGRIEGVLSYSWGALQIVRSGVPNW